MPIFHDLKPAGEVLVETKYIVKVIEKKEVITTIPTTNTVQKEVVVVENNNGLYPPIGT